MKTKSTIAILLIAFIFVACAPTISSTTTTEATATQTLSGTNTSIPTTLPTATAPPTLTLTPVPTYTPAAPDATYKLRTWSTDEADLLIVQIASNLSAIGNDPIYQGVYGTI